MQMIYPASKPIQKLRPPYHQQQPISERQQPTLGHHPHQQHPPSKCSCCPYGFHIDVDFLRSIEMQTNNRPCRRSLAVQPEQKYTGVHPEGCNTLKPVSRLVTRCQSGTLRQKYRSQSFITPTNTQTLSTAPQTLPRLSPCTSTRTNNDPSSDRETNSCHTRQLKQTSSLHRPVSASSQHNQPLTCVQHDSFSLSPSHNLSSSTPQPIFNSHLKVNSLSSSFTNSSNSVHPQQALRTPSEHPSQKLECEKDQLKVILNRYKNLSTQASNTNNHLSNQQDNMASLFDPQKLKCDQPLLRRASLRQNRNVSILQSPSPPNVPLQRTASNQHSSIIPSSVEELHDIGHQLKEILQRVNEMETKASRVPVLEKEVEMLRRANKELRSLFEKQLCSRCKASLDHGQTDLGNSMSRSLKTNTLPSTSPQDSRELRQLKKATGVGVFTSIEDNLVSEDFKKCLQQITQNMEENKIDVVPSKEKLTQESKQEMMQTAPSPGVERSLAKPATPQKQWQIDGTLGGSTKLSRRTLDLFRSLPRSFAVDREASLQTEGRPKNKSFKERKKQQSKETLLPNAEKTAKQTKVRMADEANRFIHSTLDRFPFNFKSKQKPTVSTEKTTNLCKQAKTQASKENHDNQPKEAIVDAKKETNTEKECISSTAQRLHALREERGKRRKTRSTSLTGDRILRTEVLQSLKHGELSESRSHRKTLPNDTLPSMDTSSAYPVSTDDSSTSFDEATYDGRVGRITFTTKSLDPTIF